MEENGQTIIINKVNLDIERVLAYNVIGLKKPKKNIVVQYEGQKA